MSGNRGKPHPVTPLGWWCIAGEVLLAMLRRCAEGESPDLVYAEEYANADHEHHKGDTDD